MKNMREIPQTGEIAVPKKSLRAWAACNAYTLIFLMLLFSITWILQWVIQ